MGNKTGILIKTHGQYYYRTDTTKGTKSFQLDVRAPSLEYFRETVHRYVGQDHNVTDRGTGVELGVKKYEPRSFINIRGQLKKRLLPILLGKKFPDFARIRFVVIDEIISETNEKLDLPVQLRSRKQLQELIRDNKIPINVEDYLEIDELRTDILEYQNDPNAFLQDQGRRAKRRQEEREFKIMNGLEDGDLGPRKEKKAAGILED